MIFIFLSLFNLRFMKCFHFSYFGKKIFLGLSSGKERKLNSKENILNSFLLPQLNKNVILKLKNCGWNNKLNLSRFHAIP